MLGCHHGEMIGFDPGEIRPRQIRPARQRNRIQNFNGMALLDIVPAQETMPAASIAGIPEKYAFITVRIKNTAAFQFRYVTSYFAMRQPAKPKSNVTHGIRKLTGIALPGGRRRQQKAVTPLLGPNLNQRIGQIDLTRF
jgi:hypothetical protein